MSFRELSWPLRRQRHPGTVCLGPMEVARRDGGGKVLWGIFFDLRDDRSVVLVTPCLNGGAYVKIC